MNDIKIRGMKQEDAATMSEAFRNQGWQKPAEQYQRYVREHDNGDRVSLVAEIDGDFAGYVNVIWRSDYVYFKEHRIPEINDFNVLIKYRRRGIGTLLMDKAEEIIAERSAIAGIGVGLFTDYGAAQVLYVKRGYVPDGRGIYQNGEYPQYGDQVVVDDDLALHLTKKLR
jgi:GNAT superfamily N-acetyltransferase